jgi:hypothetical protein
LKVSWPKRRNSALTHTGACFASKGLNRTRQRASRFGALRRRPLGPAPSRHPRPRRRAGAIGRSVRMRWRNSYAAVRYACTDCMSGGRSGPVRSPAARRADLIGELRAPAQDRAGGLSDRGHRRRDKWRVTRRRFVPSKVVGAQWRKSAIFGPEEQAIHHVGAPRWEVFEGGDFAHCPVVSGALAAYPSFRRAIAPHSFSAAIWRERAALSPMWRLSCMSGTAGRARASRCVSMPPALFCPLEGAGGGVLIRVNRASTI